MAEALNSSPFSNALPAHVAVIDEQGMIISVNEAWRRFDSAAPPHAPGPEVGRNYVDICDSTPKAGLSDAHQIAAGVRSVLAGAVEILSMDYACDAAMGRRWFRLTVTPLRDGTTRGAIVMHRDITDDKRIEENLRASECDSGR